MEGLGVGDRANIFLRMRTSLKGDEQGGIYLYTHWGGTEFPETLKEALTFGKGRWDDDQYLARIITSRVFSGLVDSETGAGLSLVIGDNEYPIICVDVRDQKVGFAPEGDEVNRDAWVDVKSFAEYVAQDQVTYPEGI